MPDTVEQIVVAPEIARVLAKFAFVLDVRLRREVDVLELELHACRTICFWAERKGEVAESPSSPFAGHGEIPGSHGDVHGAVRDGEISRPVRLRANEGSRLTV